MSIYKISDEQMQAIIDKANSKPNVKHGKPRKYQKE